MSVIKKPYEISVWEDVIVYVGKDNNNLDIESLNLSDLTTVEYLYYSERELAIIGSSTMTSPARTVNNVLKKNINGVETLTFDMYYQYEDIDEGLIVRNPLIDLVIDERKVKLHYDNKWYDFIVKKDDEKGRDYKYSFTCTGLAANELGKTGFSIELDTELENNMGTVQQIAQEILEGSDWLLDTDNVEVIQLTNDEALYSAVVTSEITGARTKNNTVINSISAGARIYIYYTSYVNQEKDYFLFIYVNGDTGTLVPRLYEDKITIYCDDETVYDLHLSNVTWVDGNPDFINPNVTVANYRGRRYVRKLLMAYDPVLEQTVYKYTREVDGVNKEFYGYTTTKYIDTTTVQNYIYNSTNFAGSSYWGAYGGTSTTKSVSSRVFPSVSTNNISSERAGYLVINFGNDVNTRIMNEGIILNYSRIDKFDEGEKYRFRINLNTVVNDTIHNESELPFNVIVKKYIKRDEDSGDDKIYFNSTNIDTDTENNYIIVDMDCLQSATWRDLKENVGIFFIPKSANSTDYYIKDVLFYKYVVGKNNVVIAPDDPVENLPDVRVETEYNFYDPTANIGKIYKEDYVFSDSDPSLYTPLYGSGDNEFEKIRSITAKESNRFNLLQELVETFECWVRFNIEHEDNGLIKVESYTYYNLVEITSELWETGVYYIYDLINRNYILSTEYDENKRYYLPVSRKRQVKKVSFYKDVLIENYVGFKYGINLKDNNRTLDSELIVTKIIVKDNTCDYAENGFCSIARAKDNPIKENFAYNFDYYISLGIINGSNLNNDLYLKTNGSVGLYPRLSQLNKERNDLIDSAAPLANSINNLNSELLVATLVYDAATKELARMTDHESGTLYAYTHYVYEDFYNLIDRRAHLNAGKIELGTISNGANSNSNYRVRTQGYIKVLAGHKYTFNSNISYILIDNYTSLDSSSYTSQSGWRSIGENGYSYKIPSTIEYIRIVLAQNTSTGTSIIPSDVDFITIIDEDSIIPSYGDEIYYIAADGLTSITTDDGDLSFYKVTEDIEPVTNKDYYYISSSKFTKLYSTKFRDTTVYYEKLDNAQYTADTYFLTDSTTTSLTFIGTGSPEVYIYNAARRRMDDLGAEDFINDNFTIATLEKIVTQLNNKDTAAADMDRISGDLETTLAKYDSILDLLKEIANATDEAEKEFNIKYSRYIQEGSWTDDNYMDDDLYYFDSLAVLYDSAYPKVSYNFKVLELSLLEGYEGYKFDIGHKTFVEDVEFFGYLIIDTLKTPVREAVVVTESSFNLDEPDKNDLKVQNYRSHFEDLFLRITTATQTLEYHSGEYGRAAAAVTPTGEISSTVMLKSLATSSYIIQNSRDLSVTWDETGLQAVNLNDPLLITRLASSGILVSADGGQTWGVAISGYGINTNYLTAGLIDADKINIMSGAWPTFKWDSLGLRAYGFTVDLSGNIASYDPSSYVVYDRFGIYGINGLTDAQINSVSDIRNKATFGLTWDGLFIKSTHRDGYVSISTEDDITLREYYLSNNLRLERIRGKFGLLSAGNENHDDIYGLALYDVNGVSTVETRSNGTLWLKSLMDIGDLSTNSIYIGVGLTATAAEIAKYGSGHGKKVFTVHGTGYTDETGSSGGNTLIDRFSVYEDGFIVSRGSYISGPINITEGGTIGNMTVAGLVDTVGIRISPSTGVFKVSNDIATPSAIEFSLKTGLEGTFTYTWQYGADPNHLVNVPSGWIDLDGVVTILYSNVENIFSSGLIYLKVTANGTDYSDMVSIEKVQDGEGGSLGEPGVTYIYSIESSLGTVINVDNTSETATLITGNIYYSVGGSALQLIPLNKITDWKWYYRINNTGNFTELVAARGLNTFSYSLDLNPAWDNVDFYFTATADVDVPVYDGETSNG